MFFEFEKYLKLTEIDQIEDFECFEVFDGFAPKYDLDENYLNHILYKKTLKASKHSKS
jgi:hypothetical protein